MHRKRKGGGGGDLVTRVGGREEGREWHLQVSRGLSLFDRKMLCLVEKVDTNISPVVTV